MAEEVTTAAEAPEASDATPTPQDTAPAAPPAPQEPEVTADTIDTETARKLRSEAKNLRDAKKLAEKEAADLRKQVEAFEAEKLTETERLQKEAEKNAADALEAKEALKTANLRAEVAVLAAEHGVDAEAASTLIAASVEYDDKSNPTNVTELVDGLLERGVLAKKNATPSSGLPANAQGGSPVERTHEQLLAETQSTSYGLDPYESPEALGGGVYIPN